MFRLVYPNLQVPGGLGLMVFFPLLCIIVNAAVVFIY